jgi:hypothetical protein
MNLLVDIVLQAMAIASHPQPHPLLPGYALGGVILFVGYFSTNGINIL